MIRLACARAVCILAAGLALAGCQRPGSFPDHPLANRRLPDGRLAIEYDTDGDGRVDYVQTTDVAGRIARLQFDDNQDGRFDQTVELNRIDRWAVPHLVIILDGPPLRTLEQLRTEGRFRLFPPPSRTHGRFPGMTDLGLSQLLGAGPARGYEALYYDRQRGRPAGGLGQYLTTVNSPWLTRVDYRISFGRDGDAYLGPAALFRDELAGIERTFQRAVGPGTVIAYTIGTAGLATTGGEPAVRDYLLQIDRLCERIVHQRRGQVTLTITGDHGHNLAAGQRVSFRRYLADRGWRYAPSPRRDNEYVYVEYGLVTCAVFNTPRPETLADDLAAHESADLVLYPDGRGAIVVRADRTDGGKTVRMQARVEKTKGGYRYQTVEGDPLRLRPILDRLAAAGKISADGVIDRQALFEATAEHEYPDPLERIWQAFDGLVANPADVIVSLKDPWYHGWPVFDFLVTEASTHGSLNRANSETFVLSTRQPLPPLLRQDEVMAAVGVSWADGPARRPPAGALVGAVSSQEVASFGEANDECRVTDDE